MEIERPTAYEIGQRWKFSGYAHAFTVTGFGLGTRVDTKFDDGAVDWVDKSSIGLADMTYLGGPREDVPWPEAKLGETWDRYANGVFTGPAEVHYPKADSFKPGGCDALGERIEYLPVGWDYATKQPKDSTAEPPPPAVRCPRCGRLACACTAIPFPAAPVKLERPTHVEMGQRWSFYGRPSHVVTAVFEAGSECGQRHDNNGGRHVHLDGNGSSWARESECIEAQSTFLGYAPTDTPPAETPAPGAWVSHDGETWCRVGDLLRYRVADLLNGDIGHYPWLKVDGKIVRRPPTPAPTVSIGNGPTHDKKSVHVPCRHDGPKGQQGRCWDCQLRHDRADRKVMDTAANGFGSLLIEQEAKPRRLEPSAKYPPSDDPDLDICPSWEW